MSNDALVENRDPVENLTEDLPITPSPDEVIDDDFKLSDEDVKFIKDSGGVEYFQAAKDLYEKFTATDENGQFNPTDFLSSLKEFSPARYNQIAGQVYESHKQTFVNWALEDLGVTREDFQAAKDWFAAGKPEANQEEELDPDNPLHRELIESRKERAEIARRQAEYDRQLQAQRMYEQEQVIGKEISDYTTDRVKVISTELDKMNLGSDDTAKYAKDAITAYAQYLFNQDQAANSKLEAAIHSLRKGEKGIAKGMQGDIDRKVAYHTAQASKFILDLLQAKRATQGEKTTQLQSRRDISPSVSSARPATPAPNGAGRTRGEFSPRQTVLEKLKALEADGRFSQ